MRNARERYLFPMHRPDSPGIMQIGKTNRSPRQPLVENDDRAAYGMRDGKLRFIADVPRGLACDCVCACCGRQLIAKKGSKRRHHFAHLEITNCRGAPESVLHLLSKELLAELDSLTIPPYEFTRQRKTKAGGLVRHQARVVKGGRVRVDSVMVEVSEEGFVPDIIVESNSRRLIVEVAVSSKVTRTKLRRMRRRNLPAIEIRLDPSDSFLSRDELKAKLQLDLPSKVWLFHPAQRNAERTFLSKWRSAIACDRKNSHVPSAALPAYPRTAPRFASPSRLQAAWDAYDRAFYEFHRTQGRYPNVDECLRLWPQLFKPSA